MKNINRLVTLLICLCSIQIQAQAQLDLKVEAYIQRYKDAALESQYSYGIPAAITLAQALNESAVGQSYLAQEGNNHFGIKCGSKWTGDSLHKDDDAADECFRKYDDAKQSFEDHAKFLTSNPRYASLFELDPSDYRAWAYGLKRAGYATSRTYAEDLISAIEDYNLNRWSKNSTNKTIREMLGADTESQPEERFDHSRRLIPWDSTFTYKGLKAFYAYEGKSLTPISRFYKMSLKRMLKLNDLESDLIPESSIIYLEPKYNIGQDSFYTVPAGQATAWKLSQLAALNLQDLMFLNNLKAEDIPMEGERLSLIAPNPNKVQLNTRPDVTTPDNLDLGTKEPQETQSEESERVERVVVIHQEQERGEIIEEGEEEPTEYTITREERIEIPVEEKKKKTKTIKEAENSSRNKRYSKDDEIQFDDMVHVVGKNENLNMVSLLYRVDKQDIMDRNGLSSETLYEGQELIIPPVTEKKEEPKTIKKQVEKEKPKVEEVEVVEIKKPKPKEEKKEENMVKKSEDKTKKPEPKPDERPSSGFYTVKNGDNLYRIAKKYGVTPEAIVTANKKDNQMVYVGEKLKIPGGKKEAKKEEPKAEKEEPKKTEKEKSEKETKAEKPQKEDIPSTGETDSGYEVGLHTVKKGENLYRISLKYNMTMKAIKRLNKLDGETVEVGQKLKVYK